MSLLGPRDEKYATTGAGFNKFTSVLRRMLAAGNLREKER